MTEPSAEARFGYGVLKGWARLEAEDRERSALLNATFRHGAHPSAAVRGGKRALSDDQVREIRSREGERLCDIAAEFGVCEQTISKIRAGERYREVE